MKKSKLFITIAGVTGVTITALHVNSLKKQVKAATDKASTLSRSNSSLSKDNQELRVWNNRLKENNYYYKKRLDLLRHDKKSLYKENVELKSKLNRKK